MRNVGPLVSVLIPTRNHGRLLADALESVVRQQLDAGFEVLVGDDASGDETPQTIARIAAKHPGRIVHYRHDPQVGMHGNVLHLLSHSRGEFIALLDGDDCWTVDTKLAQQVAALRRDGTAMVGHTTQMQDLTGRQLGTIPSHPLAAVTSGRRFIEEGIYLHTSSIVFRRNSLREVPSYVADPRNICLDHSLEQLISHSGDVSFLPAAMSIYRRGPTEIHTAFHRQRDLFDRALIFALTQFDRHTGYTYHSKLVYLIAQRYKSIASLGGDVPPLRRAGAKLKAETLLWRMHCGQIARMTRRILGRPSAG